VLSKIGVGVLCVYVFSVGTQGVIGGGIINDTPSPEVMLEVLQENCVKNVVGLGSL
jgi:hypothetical protein